MFGIFRLFRKIGVKNGKLTATGIAILGASLVLLIVGVYRLFD